MRIDTVATLCTIVVAVGLAVFWWGIHMIPLVWAFYYIVSGSSLAVVFPLHSRPDCEYVAKQMKETFKLSKSSCIEIPTPDQK